MRVAARWLASAIALGWLAGCVPPPTGTAITNVTVIDAIHGMREHQTVTFSGDRITGVYGPGDAFTAAETIDGSGRFLIPGLWDAHVHLTYDDRFTAAMPALFLSWGITSVRDTGGLLPRIQPVVDAMRAPGAVAPRVFYAGPLLDGRMVVYDGDARPEIGVQNATPEQARDTVKALAAAGVDFIKIYELVSPAVFNALVDAARLFNLPIAAHVPLSMRARVAGPAVDSMEHLRNIELDCSANAAAMYEERLALLDNPQGLSGHALRASLHARQRLPAIASYDATECDHTLTALAHTLQVPTLRLNAIAVAPPYERSDWDAALARLPDAAAAPWRKQAAERRANTNDKPDTRFGDWSLFLTGRAHERGVPIGAGTDTPIGLAIPGWSLHNELDMLVRAGLSPLEALRAATLRPAEFFGLQDDMGAIEAGRVADLLLLDADPLEDIRHTRRIHRVISRGRVFDVDTLTAMARAAHR